MFDVLGIGDGFAILSLELVFGRTEQGDVACFVKQVQVIFQRCFVSLLIVGLDPWRSVVEVGWEDGFGALDHEKWCVASGPTGGCPQALEHHEKLRDPSSAKFVQPVEDPRLEAL